jgi:hypothetical protein
MADEASFVSRFGSEIQRNSPCIPRHFSFATVTIAADQRVERKTDIFLASTTVKGRRKNGFSFFPDRQSFDVRINIQARKPLNAE